MKKYLCIEDAVIYCPNITADWIAIEKLLTLNNDDYVPFSNFVARIYLRAFKEMTPIDKETIDIIFE